MIMSKTDDLVLPIALLCGSSTWDYRSGRVLYGGLVYFNKTNEIKAYNLDTLVYILNKARSLNRLCPLCTDGEHWNTPDVAVYLNMSSNGHMGFSEFSEALRHDSTKEGLRNVSLVVERDYSCPVLTDPIGTKRETYLVGIESVFWMSNHCLPPDCHILIEKKYDKRLLSSTYRVIFPNLEIRYINEDEYKELKKGNKISTSCYIERTIESQPIDICSEINVTSGTVKASDFKYEVKKDFRVGSITADNIVPCVVTTLFGGKRITICKQLVENFDELPSEFSPLHFSVRNDLNYSSEIKNSLYAYDGLYLLGIARYKGEPLFAIWFDSGYADIHKHTSSILAGCKDWTNIPAISTFQFKSTKSYERHAQGLFISDLSLNSVVDQKYRFKFNKDAFRTSVSYNNALDCWYMDIRNFIRKNLNNIAIIDLYEKEG